MMMIRDKLLLFFFIPIPYNFDDVINGYHVQIVT